MITTLHIKNMGIIDDICVEFDEGLNVLTGETGAGKSLILEAINLICGGRFSKELIRKNCEFLLVEASFFVPNNAIFDTDNVTISRKIYQNGKNICKINSNLVSVSELNSKMLKFVDIHSQNDNQEILHSQNHIKFLDSYANTELKNVKEEYIKSYNEYLDIKNKLKENYGDEREKQRKISLLKYQLNEIEMSNLKEGEDELLENRKKILTNSEKLFSSLVGANDNIENNILSSFDSVIKSMSKIAGIDEKYENEYQNLQNMYYELQDISSNLYSYSQEIEFSDSDLESIEQRIDLIYDLKRKYGNNITEILKYKDSIKEELTKIENIENYVLELRNKEVEIKEKLENSAKLLDDIRVRYAKILENSINLELESLDMKNVKIKIQVEYDISKQFNENGLNRVKILVSTNVGSDFLQIEKIASGGEISRIMLAIKSVFSESKMEEKTIIFDEIDTGISGIAAIAVSEKLKKLSKFSQILCVTHQAVLAAKANANYYIYKTNDEKQTKSNIKRLTENEIIEEIARMSSGEKSDISIKYAKNLRRELLLKVG